MAAGGNEPGAMVCEECHEKWFSTAFLREGDHTCPSCGGQLSPSGQSDADD